MRNADVLHCFLYLLLWFLCQNRRYAFPWCQTTSYPARQVARYSTSNGFPSAPYWTKLICSAWWKCGFIWKCKTQELPKSEAILMPPGGKLQHAESMITLMHGQIQNSKLSPQTNSFFSKDGEDLCLGKFDLIIFTVGGSRDVLCICIYCNHTNLHLWNIAISIFLYAYCQKYWDTCLYIHMNFNDFPFLIHRV